jgi:hypothetical protein
MPDDAEAEAVVPVREGVTEEAAQAHRGSQQTTTRARRTPRQATSALERAKLAKRRELAAHLRAIELHEQAAALQDRLGHPDRAANARQHAEHARELYECALEEQAAQDGLHRAG